jgi:hypothetical protein
MNDQARYGTQRDRLQPRYATPPKKEWVGLTDDEIKEVASLGIYEKPLIEFARDIEAKLKEKNSGNN